MPIEVLRERWRIVERKDGAIFRTEYVEDVWRDIDAPRQEGDDQFAVKSSGFNGKTIRISPGLEQEEIK